MDWQAVIRGDAIVVGDVRVGDSVGTLAIERMTRIDPATPNVSRSYRDGLQFDVAADGTETLLTPAMLHSELLRFGGFVHVERVTVRVADGHVDAIILSSPFDDSPFATEADIARLLGVPDGIERAFGDVTYHYRARSLSIRWRPATNRIASVRFGRVDWTPPIADRTMVLAEWLRAEALLSPTWEEPADRTTSRWVRHARVHALLRAFELGAPDAFSRGLFLSGAPHARFPKTSAALKEHGQRSPETSDAVSPWFFWWLLRYRQSVERVLTFHSGLLEASLAGVAEAVHITLDATTRVRAATADVEELLLEMISPENRTIPLSEIADWPDVDLEQLERDEQWG